MPLSNQQVKQIKRLYPAKTPEVIGKELGVPLHDVYKALGLQEELYQRWLERAACITIKIMLLCAPFIFIKGLNDFADLPQRVMLQTGTLILALLYIIDVTLKRTLEIPLGIVPVFSVLFVLWAWACCAWTHSPYEALYAVLHWSCGPVLFFLIVHFLRIPSSINGAFTCIAAALCGTVALGLLQYFFDVRIVPQSIKPAAGFANPNVAAEYVVLVLPVVIAAALNRKHLFARMLLLVLLTGVFAFLAAARCRAAWLALMMAGVWAALLFIKTRMNRRALSLTVLVAAAAVVLTTASLYAGGQLGKVIRFAGGSALYRMIVWENSLAMLQDKPLLGFGPAGFKVFYPGYKDRAVIDRAFDKEKQIRRAHNDYVQQAVETGIPGFLFFAGILISGLGYALRALSRTADPAQRMLVFGVSAGIVSFMTTAFFGFPFQRAVQPVVVFVFLALLWRWQKKRTVSVVFPRAAGYAALVFVCVVGGILLQFHVKNITAERYFQTALQFEKGRANKKALEAALTAHSFNPNRMDILTTLGRAYVTTGDLEKGIAALERVVKTQPYNLNALFILGAAYANRGDKERAFATFARVLKIKSDFLEARQIICGLKTNGAVRVNIL
ncbi:MAG: O-antigen ligase family protein [Desulfobacterota bacterium]|nr:O-antigen ligase family protein [Thermodesulfobacteriota bacterium]